MSGTTPIERYREIVRERFGGRLHAGAHAEDGRACVFEALSVVEGRAWSDATCGRPDARMLNDRYQDDARRTAAMERLVEHVLLPWEGWSIAARLGWAERVAVRIVRELMSEWPWIDEPARVRCRATASVADVVVALELALDRALDLDLARALELALDRALARALDLDLARARARDLARALELARALDRALDLARALGQSERSGDDYWDRVVGVWVTAAQEIDR